METAVLGASGGGRRLNLLQLSEMLNNGDLKRAPKLTPRSRAACRRVGVLPLELMLRESESFAEEVLDPEIQRMRHEAYVHERRTQLELAQSERTRCIAEEEKEAMRSKVAAANGDEDQSATFLEQEQRRLVKIQRRQQREIEQMLEYEMKVTKIQQEANEKTEREEERKAVEERKKNQRKKAVAEERRQRELRRQQQKEEAEKQRRAVEYKAFLKDKALAERAMQAEAEATREQRAREIERQAKAVEHRKQQEAALAKQQLEIEARFEEMQRAEAERERVMLAQREQRAREVKKKRRLIDARIRANSMACMTIEEKQRTDYMRKQQAMEERRYRRSEEVAIEREEKIRLSQVRRRLLRAHFPSPAASCRASPPTSSLSSPARPPRQTHRSPHPPPRSLSLSLSLSLSFSLSLSSTSGGDSLQLRRPTERRRCGLIRFSRTRKRLSR
jgi:hypothetical protein